MTLQVLQRLTFLYCYLTVSFIFTPFNRLWIQENTKKQQTVFSKNCCNVYFESHMVLQNIVPQQEVESASPPCLVSLNLELPCSKSRCPEAAKLESMQREYRGRETETDRDLWRVWVGAGVYIARDPGCLSLPRAGTGAFRCLHLKSMRLQVSIASHHMPETLWETLSNNHLVAPSQSQ